jgi:hypothetical protein
VTQDQEENKPLVDLLHAGSDVAGAVGGAAIGLVVEGPAGALGGAAAGSVVGQVLRGLGAEIQRRLLSPREQARVGAAAAFAITAIAARLERGASLRDDGFFDAGVDGRSDAEEILEAVLMKAQDSYEERKVRHLAYLFVATAFEPNMSAARANYFVTLGSRLTYRQLTILGAYYGIDRERRMRLRDLHYWPNTGVKLTDELDTLLTELFDLYRQGLIKDPERLDKDEPIDLWPRRLELQESGWKLAWAMRLNTIPIGDQDAVLSGLGDPIQPSS